MLEGIAATALVVGFDPVTREDWVAQYGDLWAEFARRKKKYDPDNILTPGPGIF